MLPSFAEARAIVVKQAEALPAPGSEPVELERAAGRVLAAPVCADRDFPPFARATRDGYAVRAAEVASPPAELKAAGELRAGADPRETVRPLPPGVAIEIMTGASVPPGADAVVMIEHTAAGARSGLVIINRAVAVGENIVPRGAEAKQGAVLLEAGTRLGPEQIALAAGCGHARVPVFVKPRVAILSTGDEVVDIAATPGPNQIRNSNAYGLAAQVREAGGEAIILPIAPDEPLMLRKLIEEGLAADLLLLSGGVSMGKHDLVEGVLQQLRGEFFFTGAEIQPGRPVVFGRAPRPLSPASQCYFFGLPGNPISTLVCFELFSRPWIEALAGAAPSRLRTAAARLQHEARYKPGLTRFLPAALSGGLGNETVSPLKWQGSGDLATAARANCWLVVPDGREKLEAGEWVSVVLRG